MVRDAVAAAGLAKATIVVPAIERLAELRLWLEAATHLSASQLQAHVSEALHALPRGREVEPPGERFRRAILGAMSDIDAMEVVERFFDVGARVVGTGHPVAIFLAGCRECLGEWEPQAAYAGRARARGTGTPESRGPANPAGDADCAGRMPSPERSPAASLAEAEPSLEVREERRDFAHVGKNRVSERVKPGERPRQATWLEWAAIRGEVLGRATATGSSRCAAPVTRGPTRRTYGGGSWSPRSAEGGSHWASRGSGVGGRRWRRAPSLGAGSGRGDPRSGVATARTVGRMIRSGA